MKRYFLLVLSVFFVACSSANSNFVTLSLPKFKPQVPNQTQTTYSGVKVFVEPVMIEQNNNYSDYFENSVLKIRLEKEFELLKQNLEAQIKAIMRLKGYEIVNSNADYKVQTLISVYMQESKVQKSSSFVSGDSIQSDFSLSFNAKIDFVDMYNTQNATNFLSSTKLDNPVSLSYPIRNNDGLVLFKASVSSVATQLNKGLENAAFELDKSFLAFYKTTVNTLYSNLANATEQGKTSKQEEKEYNEFIQENNFNEENFGETKPDEEDENSSEQYDGVTIFE